MYCANDAVAIKIVEKIAISFDTMIQR